MKKFAIITTGVIVAVITLSYFLTSQLASLADRAVQIQNAQAIIESARSAQESAKAAQIASAGLADVARMQAFSILLLFVIAALIIGVGTYLVLESRKSQPERKSQAPRQLHRPMGQMQLPPNSDDLLFDFLLAEALKRRKKVQPPPVLLDGDDSEEKVEW